MCVCIYIYIYTHIVKSNQERRPLVLSVLQSAVFHECHVRTRIPPYVSRAIDWATNSRRRMHD